MGDDTKAGAARGGDDADADLDDTAIDYICDHPDRFAWDTFRMAREIRRLRAAQRVLSASLVDAARLFELATKHVPPPPLTADRVGPVADRAHQAGRLQRISLLRDDGKVFLGFDAPCVIKIGKMGSNHVVIAEEKVGRLHAVIEADFTGLVTIMDLGSPYGTFLNGTAINRSPLTSGDLIQIGQTRFKVTLEPIEDLAPAPGSAGQTGRHA